MIVIMYRIIITGRAKNGPKLAQEEDLKDSRSDRKTAKFVVFKAIRSQQTTDKGPKIPFNTSAHTKSYMNLETKLNGAVDDVLRSAGLIFEVINHNKRNSNLILGPNTQLVSSNILEQLLANLARFDGILDETVGKLNDTKWCIDQILENKLKQEALRLKEEEEKRKKAAEQEKLRKEQEEKVKRDLEAKEKKRQEEAAALAKQKLEKEQKKRLEEERIQLEKRKLEEEVAKKKQQQQEEADKKLGFDTGFNFSPGFDFNMDDFGGGDFGVMGDVMESSAGGEKTSSAGVTSRDSGNQGSSGVATKAGNAGNAGNSGSSANAGNTGNPGGDASTTKNDVDVDMYMGFDPMNTAPVPKQDPKAMDDNMNTLLDTDALLLDGLDMDLYEGDNGIGSGNGEEEFDVDSFLNQFGGA